MQGSNLIWRYLTSLSVCIVLSVMAHGPSLFNPNYSIDTYSFSHPGQPAFPYARFFIQGRYGLAALQWFREAIGYSGFDVAVSSIMLAVILFALAGLFFAWTILKSPSKVEVFIFIAFFTIHPFGTEFYTFSDATLNVAIAIFIAALGIAATVRITRPVTAAFVGLSLIVLSLSIYQLVISHILVVCIFTIVARLVPIKSPPKNTAVIAAPEARAVMVALASVAVYLLIAAIIARVIHTPIDARNDISGLIYVHQKLAIMIKAVQIALWPSPGLVAPFASALLLVLLVLGTASLLWPILKRGSIPTAVICLALLAGGLIWAAGASAAGNQQTWLVARVLSSISIFAGGILMLGWRCASPTLRKLFSAALVLLCISYIGSSNRILNDQRRLNLWDNEQANRFLIRLEGRPDFQQMSALAIVGGSWRRSVPLETAGGDMNVSALAVPLAKLGLIEQATGFHFDEPKPAELQIAQDYCASAMVWPADDSVTIIKNVGIVCLTKP